MNKQQHLLAGRGKTLVLVAGAFAAGIAGSLLAFRLVNPTEPLIQEEEVVPEVPRAEAAPSFEAASTASTASTRRPVIVDNSVHLKQPMQPNPFARPTTGLQRVATQQAPSAYVPAVQTTFPYGDYSGAAPVEPSITPAWAQRIRAWCARWKERDRPRCASLAQAMQRIVVDDEGAQDIWARDMEKELADMLEAISPKDLSYREVSCTLSGCVLYWQTENYAKPTTAGNLVFDALVRKGWLAEGEDPAQRRMAGFNPTTSVAWEALVLERTQ